MAHKKKKHMHDKKMHEEMMKASSMPHPKGAMPMKKKGQSRGK